MCDCSVKSGAEGETEEIVSLLSTCEDKSPEEVRKERPKYDECKIPLSSSCSSESSRNYNFVEAWELESPDGEGEETPEFPPIHCGPCTVEEEEPEEPEIECTLAIIKPEAVVHRRQIENLISQEGFEVYQTRWLQLTPEQVADFYADNYGKTSFAHLVAYMASAPILVLVLAKHKAVQEWRMLMGPTKVTEARLYFPDSIRSRFGRRGEDFKNAVHGSTSRDQAEKEIHFFFPNFIVEPLLKGEMAVDFLWDTINTVLLEGLALCCKLKPADPILWLANWLILNNPHKPKLPEDLAVVPT